VTITAGSGYIIVPGFQFTFTFSVLSNHGLLRLLGFLAEPSASLFPWIVSLLCTYKESVKSV